MRIVFVGAVAFSRSCLEAIVAARGNVVAVVTLEPRLLMRHGDGVDLSEAAGAAGIPVYRVTDVNAVETLDLVRRAKPDLICVLGWSQLLGPELLSLAPCIGSHPALLPRDRGRHPITWALVDGYEESGLTFLWLDEGADSGDILWQRSFPIRQEDDAADVYRAVERLAAEAIPELLPQLEIGTAPRIPQDLTGATYRRRRTEADRWIDWHQSARDIHNLVRGLARPYVGALTRSGRQDVIVWRARVWDGGDSAAEAQPGAVSRADGRLVVSTGEGAVVLIEVEPAAAIAAGDVLEVGR
jgi:methionyl-tRNA formyltransferase